MLQSANWDPQQQDPTGWWMSEKYDGVRAYWTGSKMVSRSGREIRLPDSIRELMPSIALDGELWVRRGMQQDALVLLQSKNELLWKNASFCVFDVPEVKKPFEERLEVLKNLTSNNFVKVIEFVKCSNKEHLQQFFKSVIEKGGEGVMLREPESMYVAKRSNTLCKYKVSK